MLTTLIYAYYLYINIYTLKYKNNKFIKLHFIH